jgi:hypothetical protein
VAGAYWMLKFSHCLSLILKEILNSIVGLRQIRRQDLCKIIYLSQSITSAMDCLTMLLRFYGRREVFQMRQWVLVDMSVESNRHRSQHVSHSGATMIECPGY